MTTLYTSNIQNDTLLNENFRKVLYTGKMQLVLMKLNPGEEIGEEVHTDTDQFFSVKQGEAKFIVDGIEYIVQVGGILIVPAGSKHNVINSGTEVLKLYTIYAPAQHPDNTVQETKPE